MSLLRDNRRLLDGYRKADPDVLMVIYRHYARAVGSFLLEQGPGDAIDIDDALQETFMRAFNDRARLAYDGLGSFKNYLFTIGRNLVVDARRRRRATATAPETFDQIPTPDLTPERAGDVSELRRLIEGFLDALSPVEVKLIELRFKEGLSQNQTASHMSLSRQNVRTLEIRVRKRLYEALADSGYLDIFQTDGGSPTPSRVAALGTSQLLLLLLRGGLA